MSDGPPTTPQVGAGATKKAPLLNGGGAGRSAHPESVERLIAELTKLPGIGRRSAERIAFHVLKCDEPEAMRLARAIEEVKKNVRHCSVCFNLTDADGVPTCPLCADERRDRATVLVVEQPRDLIALEQTGMYRGVYHVLMGRLSPLDGVGPDHLTVAALVRRVKEPGIGSTPIREVVLGMNPTVEGDGTALYVAEQLRPLGVKVSRLARGVPTGGQLEYANKAVLADAIQGRQAVE